MCLDGTVLDPAPLGASTPVETRSTGDWTPQLMAVKFKVRAYNRCGLCGRPRAFLKKFQMCRICFRNRALKGEITGVIKSSW
jgi:small subunit ribosomal protein S14